MFLAWGVETGDDVIPSCRGDDIITERQYEDAVSYVEVTCPETTYIAGRKPVRALLLTQFLGQLNKADLCLTSITNSHNFNENVKSVRKKIAFLFLLNMVHESETIKSSKLQF